MAALSRTDLGGKWYAIGVTNSHFVEFKLFPSCSATSRGKGVALKDVRDVPTVILISVVAMGYFLCGWGPIKVGTSTVKSL